MTGQVRVLLVEDDVELVEITTEMFASHGIVVDACRSATEAMKSMMSNSYDAVVTDVALAHGESGLDLCRSLSRTWPELVIVVLSGNISAKRRALALGASAFFEKPVELVTVSDFIQNACR